jgi:hypothetical protein
MGTDWSNLVAAPLYDQFSRPIIVTPIVSQPGAPAYSARGIFDTDEMDYPGLDGSIISNSRTRLDLKINEFAIIPQQDDIIDIPPDPNSDIAGGMFEVVDSAGFDNVGNAGGEISLTLRRIMPPRMCYVKVEAFYLGSLDFAKPTVTVT